MRRIAFKLAVFLLLGAILNIAVAWGAAFCQQDVSSLMLADNARGGASKIAGSNIAVLGGTAHGQCATMFMIGHDDADSFDLDDFEEPIQKVAPSWADISAHFRVDAIESKDGELFVAHGWPCRTAWCKYVLSYGTLPNLAAAFKNPNANVSGGLRLSNRSWRLGSLPFQKAIPLHPIWPGFAINTIFYAAILWLPFAMIGVARRRRRAHRGRCVACGYDLRGSKNKLCPECGRPSSSPLRERAG